MCLYLKCTQVAFQESIYSNKIKIIYHVYISQKKEKIEFVNTQFRMIKMSEKKTRDLK